MKLLGIAGSLREGSYNRGLLRAARELLPEGVELVEFDIRSLPFYDGDVEAAGDPEPVMALKDAIRDADALLIATPEYNRGVPGGLKNAVDWASRPPLGSPLAGKPVALMGASTGRGGTALAQQQLREALEFPRAIVLDEPQVLVPEAYLRFDEHGDLVETTAIRCRARRSCSTPLFMSRAVLRSRREHRPRTDDQRRPGGRPRPTRSARPRRRWSSAASARRSSPTTARLIGIVTERDLTRAVAGRVHSSEARVREWMTADPLTLEPDATPEDAAKIMLDNGFRHVPIVEDGRAVGIVSIRDVARWSTEEDC